MTNDTILVHFDWDSGPMARYYAAGPNTKPDPTGRCPNGGSGPILPVPRSIWEQYTKAEAELINAEEALEAAMRAQRATRT